MQPGSLERIEYYRQLAESETPLFDNAPAGIPMLPKPKPVLPPKRIEEKPMNIDQAIQLLTGEGAEEMVNQQIEKLETELEKLKNLKRIYKHAGTRQATALDSDVESKVVKYVTKYGPTTPKEMAEAIGISYMKIGKTVAVSSKLTKSGNCVILAK